MCNAAPGHRCDGGAYTSVEESVEKYVKLCDEVKNGDSPKKVAQAQAKLDKEGEALKEKVVFYFSTNKVQGSDYGSNSKIGQMLSAIPKKERLALGININDSKRTGKVLNSFQSTFENYVKADPNGSTIASARIMNDVVLKKRRDEMLEKVTQQYNRGAKKAMGDNLDKDQVSVQASFEKNYNDKVNSINQAYDIMSRDTQKALQRDMNKNSTKDTNDYLQESTEIKKNIDGTFTITNSFQIEAKNFGEAVEGFDQRYANKNIEVQPTFKPSPTHVNTYDVTGKYVYRGHEEKVQAVRSWYFANIRSNSWFKKRDKK